MKKIEEVTLLYEISKALNEYLDLRKTLYRVLEILSTMLNTVRGTVSLLDMGRLGVERERIDFIGKISDLLDDSGHLLPLSLALEHDV